MFSISSCSVLEEFVHLLYLGRPFYWCIVVVVWSPVMGGAVFHPCWLIILRCPSTGAHGLLGGARSWWENGDLQKGSCQWELPRTTAASVFFPAVGPSCSLLPQETLQFQQVDLAQALLRSLLFSLGPSAFETLCAPSRNGVYVSPSPVDLLCSNPADLQS